METRHERNGVETVAPAEQRTRVEGRGADGVCLGAPALAACYRERWCDCTAFIGSVLAKL